ncbi:MAG: hypothetical protein IKN45_01955 [Lachnospiraceae bacterium]|nr:hypothetical protein [Lachnospiraceae bacterium]
MMKMKLNKKIAGATAMLLLSATMLGTSTFAWFTMSRTVKVDGMEVKTKVSGNLLISDSNISDNYYGTELTQSKKAILEPVSSINGSNNSFYYTLDAKADGSKLHTASGTYAYISYGGHNEAATNPTDYANKISENYAITKAIASQTLSGTEVNQGAQGYVDYVFYLKANADESNNEIRLTRCNLSYNGAAISNSGSDKTTYDKAWRVGVFATTTSVGDQSATPETSGALSILGLSDAAYFDNQAVAGTSSYSAPVNFGTAVKLNATPLTPGSITYYKVVVRLWLEGQDTACKTDTYANLNNSWKLDLQFDMVPSTDTTTAGIQAVTAIGTSAPATVNHDVPAAP